MIRYHNFDSVPQLLQTARLHVHRAVLYCLIPDYRRRALAVPDDAPHLTEDEDMAATTFTTKRLVTSIALLAGLLGAFPRAGGTVTAGRA